MGAASVGTSSTPIRRKETMQDVSTIQKYFPITQWMKIVTTHTALTDFISGITIGLIILPQVSLKQVFESSNIIFSSSSHIP